MRMSCRFKRRNRKLLHMVTKVAPLKAAGIHTLVEIREDIKAFCTIIINTTSSTRKHANVLHWYSHSIRLVMNKYNYQEPLLRTQLYEVLCPYKLTDGLLFKEMKLDACHRPSLKEVVFLRQVCKELPMCSWILYREDKRSGREGLSRKATWIIL